jgi:hypothetical protein
MMGSKEQRKNQHIRRTKRALAKAKARRRSEYVVGRISKHLKECEEGKPHGPNLKRSEARLKNQEIMRARAPKRAAQEEKPATLADSAS